MTPTRLIADVVARRGWANASTQTRGRLAQLLRDEGIDLTRATSEQLVRGTPVYVEASADVYEVQRLMAQNHILRLPVLENGSLLAIVDLVEIALRLDGKGPGEATETSA